MAAVSDADRDWATAREGTSSAIAAASVEMRDMMTSGKSRGYCIPTPPGVSKKEGRKQTAESRNYQKADSRKQKAVNCLGAEGCKELEAVIPAKAGTHVSQTEPGSPLSRG
jgi:hypothetical protein